VTILDSVPSHVRFLLPRVLFPEEKMSDAPDSPPKNDVMLLGWIRQVQENLKNGIDGLAAWQSLSRAIVCIRAPSKDLPEIGLLIEEVQAVARERLITSAKLEVAVKLALAIIKDGRGDKLPACS
jgi:hypothetical protein